MDKTLLQLVEIIAAKCIKDNNMIICAESCTGGMLSAYLTALPGSSKYFSHGYVTYSNEAKHKLLGVKTTSLNKYGAVSEVVAKEMAAGCLENDQNIALSITGIAGPGGGSRNKPVGTVYIGIAQKNILEAKRFCFEGNRNEIRLKTCEAALNILIKYLNNI